MMNSCWPHSQTRVLILWSCLVRTLIGPYSLLGVSCWITFSRVLLYHIWPCLVGPSCQVVSCWIISACLLLDQVRSCLVGSDQGVYCCTIILFGRVLLDHVRSCLVGPCVVLSMCHAKCQTAPLRLRICRPTAIWARCAWGQGQGQ